MTDRPIKNPGSDHPITIEPQPGKVVVRLGGRTVAESANALTLREASYPAVFYIPRVDVDMSQLSRTDHSTYCPYKGDASYFSIPVGGDRSRNAVWSYEQPHSAVREIADHLAFYPDRVDAIEVA